MFVRRVTIAVTAIAVTVGLLGISSPAASAKTSHPKTLTFFIKQTVREALDFGGTGPTTGDVVTGSGDVAKQQGGTAIGSYAYRSETVRVNMPGGLENRNSTVWFTVPGGTIATAGLISVPQGTRPVAAQQYIVLGGTGRYAGVRGTMTFVPLGPDDFRTTFHLMD